MAQTFDQEFRDNAVRMALEKKMSQKQLAQMTLGLVNQPLPVGSQPTKKDIKLSQEKTQSKKKFDGLRRKMRFCVLLDDQSRSRIFLLNHIY